MKVGASIIIKKGTKHERELIYNREQEETYRKVYMLFKDENKKPIELTPKQCDIFNLIWKRKVSVAHLMAHTRYGKSLVVGLAVLLRIATFSEKWAIVAPDKAKASIIMSYIIEHIFDHDYFVSKLKIDKGESVESLRRHRKKDRLNFKHSDGTYGEVFVIGVEAGNSKKAGDAAMGFGAPNVILDEAALLDDDVESKIFRMLGDNTDNYFYLKIGNPFRRNHFYKDYRDGSIFHMNIDAKIGIEEGRITEEFLEKASNKPNFEVLYYNIFPASDLTDEDGWTVLLTDEQIETALTTEDIPMFGDMRLGVDVAKGGGNLNVQTLRGDAFAKILRKDEERNTMVTAGNIIQTEEALGLDPKDTFIDGTGVGAGVCDRIREQGRKVNVVILGETPLDEGRYLNIRAEAYWALRTWIIAGGKLKIEHGRDKTNTAWWQLADIKWKTMSSKGKIQIMPKEQMLKKGLKSPDEADSLMLTFCRPEKKGIQKQMLKKVKRIRREGPKRGIKLRMA